MKNLLAGILIGAGAILPGISSRWFYVLFWIIWKILHFFKDAKNNLKFILPIAIGVFVGVFLVGNLLKIAFDKFYMEASFAVIGLILRKFKISC